MTVLPEQGPVGPDVAGVLPGDLVRELVARRESEIADLEARLAEAEAAAASAERAVRRHPALVLLHPDEVRRLAPDPPDQTAIGTAPARTTVVRRAAPAAPHPPADGAPGGRSQRPAAPEPAPGLGARIVRSHWWWRVGIALVVVALLLLKLG